jgi:23S rRNA pseudouridine1911/1915/1917 synthase
LTRPPSRLRLVADRDEPLLALVMRRGGIGQEAAETAIRRGGAFVSGRRVREPSAGVRARDRVEVTLRAPPAPALSRDCVLHVDELVIAIDKPAGIAAQEDLAGGPALPDLCSALLGELGEEQTQALLVHRLDRGTTGVTLLARTRRAQQALLAEFRAHRARKEYRALVAPAPAEDAGVADAPVGSRPALTRFRVLERFADSALVQALPGTGRTHQIRIHLSGLGCPLLGDKAHGGRTSLTRPSGARHDFLRPMLHASSLAVRHPRQGELRADAPLPADFAAALDFLRR